MADQESEEKAPPPTGSSSEASTPPSERGVLKPMTPEMRRFLGRARSRHDPVPEDELPKDSPPATEEKIPRLSRERKSEVTLTRQKEEKEKEKEEEEEEKREDKQPVEEEPAGAEADDKAPAQQQMAVLPDQKFSRIAQMQRFALIIGTLFLLGATFYIGHKAAYWKYLIMSRNQPKLADMAPDKFPELPADELIEQALAAERMGNWREAVERMVAAKQRNLSYRGILFRAGKLCYDHGDFDNADKLLERAIAFGEHVDTANFLRGLMAVGHSDLAAAQRFFEAAVTAEPFIPGYYYYWAEALRRNHQPNEAIRRYEQAAARATSEQDAVVCRFKVRLARIEAAEGPQLGAEIEKKRSEGTLSVDWLLTDAALQIQQSDIVQGVQLIEQARTADEARLFSLFASCTSDMLFNKASRNHPEIAQACRVGGTSTSPSPSPVSVP